MAVNTPNKAYDGMALDWAVVDALSGGTRAMREAGELYLPKRLMEHNDDYNTRLKCATLYPAFDDTVRYMTGRIFADPVLLQDDIPGWLKEEVLEDVDLGRLNFHSFLGKVMDDAMRRGLSYVLVDAPNATPTTRAEQKAAGLRPYALHICPKRVLGWQLDDRGQLTQVRITFNEVEYDPLTFEERCIERIRVYEIGKVRVYELKKKGSEKEWVEVPELARTTGLSFIPLVCFYTGRTGMMTARPPLMELAHLNVKHWHMQSSNDDLVETAQVPILTATGMQDPKKGIVIGAKTAINLPANGKLQYVEHGGTAIASGRTALDSLKTEMRDAGARLLAPMTQVKTATQAGEEAQRENSALAQIVRDMEDSAALVLDYLAAFRGGDDGGSIKAQANLDPELAPIESLNFLLNMANSGYLSPETLFSEAKRRAILSEELEWEDEQVKIKESEPEPLPLPVLPPGNVPPQPPQPGNVPPEPGE